MKAAIITAFGAPDVVSISERAQRVPQANEARVRIDAASINPLDLKMIAGYMQQFFPVDFPYVPGTDFSGTVDAIGAQVNNLKVGDRVFGRAQPSAGGAFAKSLVVAASELCLVPEQMSSEQAAALPTAFGTAQQALFTVGGVKGGERILIHAGAGGVGSMAIQLAHNAGAYVIATASEKNIDLLKSLGADEVIDYRTQDFAEVRDVDFVLDTIGGEILKKSWSVLRAGGRIATLVEFGIQSVNGNSGEFVFFSDATPYLPIAVRLFQAEQLQIITDSVFPFDEARSALERVATGRSRGKVVLRISV